MSYVRRSARVFVLDAADRVLLLRCNLVFGSPGSAQIWVTPGGGVEEGERLHEAATREVWEEIGLRVDPEALLPQVAMMEGDADIGGLGKGRFREDYFVCRVAEHKVDVSGQSDDERRELNEFRWWSLDELERTTEFVVPLGMAGLLREVVTGRLPDQPVTLPSHH